MRFLVTAVILLVAALQTNPLQAGPVADALMQPGIWANGKPSDLPRYQHARHRPTSLAAPRDMTPPSEIEAGEVDLSLTDGADPQRLVLSLTQNKTRETVAEFPTASANPILLFFLENVMRNVASDTGGSPYYIRNRIRDALVAAQTDTTEGQVELILQPFAEDLNRDRLGLYADLSITLRYDTADPARILELLADTGEGPERYTEKMTLIPET